MNEVAYNEKELLQKVSEGDTLAFRELFDMFHPPLYTIIERLTGSQLLTDDLVQDCFLKVWLNRATLPQLDNFGGWLRTIASHLTIDALRKQKADARRDEAYHSGEMRHRSFTPTENLLLEKEYTGMIHEAVASLPERQRQVFILVKQQGLSRMQAAQALNIGEETVKSSLKAATLKVRAYCLAKMGMAGMLLLSWFNGRMP